jgi:hypothetical protein
MAKKKAGALVEAEPENQEQADLRDLLKSFDNAGVQLVEEQWRRFSESEQNIAQTWLKSRLAGNPSVLPLFLGEFASIELARELDAHLAQQREHRRVLAPCVFAKPGFGQAADGLSTVVVKVKIPDKNLGDRSAISLWGKTRCNIEFSRRACHEWQRPEKKNAEWEAMVAEGPMRIVECEADIMAFGWRDENWTVSFLVPEDVISLDEARTDWNKQGSIRFEVIGKAKRGSTASDDDGGDDEDLDDVPPEPKAKPTAKAATPALPGVEPVEATFSVAVSAAFMVELRVIQQSDGRWKARWLGEGPTGVVESAEPSIRASEIEAAAATLGRAHDTWAAWDDAESKEILAGIKFWLAGLSAGRTPAAIEAEDAD